MRILTRLFLASALFAAASAAQAMMVDLKAAADGAYGESAWNPLSLSADFGIDVDIYGVKAGDNDAYAYLDSNGAGLGVCGDISGDANEKNANSTSNLCDPSSDDNVTEMEALRFVFNEDVVIDKLWFNNNHDSPFTLIDYKIDIFGDVYEFDSGDVDNTRDDDVMYVGPIYFDAGQEALIAYEDQEFYLSAMEIHRNVPEPMTLGLLGFGLIGLGFARRGARRS